MYRTQSIILGPRWGVTFWRRGWYVRVVRIFFNLKKRRLNERLRKINKRHIVSYTIY